MPHMDMAHDVDPKQALLDILGDISELRVFNNKVLVAIYTRPEKTAGGIFLTDKTREEDKWQGKVGLIIKMGPEAFDDPSGQYFRDVNISLHDWVWFRPSDGFPVTTNSKEGICRLFRDVDIYGVIPHPDMIW